MNLETPPFQIAKPCTANWDKMHGDDKRRFCEHCQKHVHNLSAMSNQERTSFAESTKGEVCIAYQQRADGAIANLSILAILRRWFPLLRLVGWSALMAFIPLILTGCMGVRKPRATMGVIAIPKCSSEPTPNFRDKNSASVSDQMSPTNISSSSPGLP